MKTIFSNFDPFFDPKQMRLDETNLVVYMDFLKIEMNPKMRLFTKIYHNTEKISSSSWGYF